MRGSKKSVLQELAPSLVRMFISRNICACPPHDICGLYCSYVTKKYGKAIVVFDGYDDMSTKNMTHQRRAAEKAGATVSPSQRT